MSPSVFGVIYTLGDISILGIARHDLRYVIYFSYQEETILREAIAMAKLPKCSTNEQLFSSLPMIGKRSHMGPGGRDCPCCNEAPGKPRKVEKRHNKRSERQRSRQLIERERQYAAYQMGWC